MLTKIRPGTSRDVESLIALDPVAVINPKRTEFIQHAIRADTCYVAEVDQQIVGYSVLTHNFYDNGMVELLVVRDQDRRAGVGTALLNHMVLKCETPKLFTSTNQSNKPMQVLLAANGFVKTGFIDNLDDGDPELIYFKRIAD